MKLEKIVVSGANETTCMNDLFNLAHEFKNIEFGIQVSGKKCTLESPRMHWLESLAVEIRKREDPLPLALHINTDWVHAFTDGHIPFNLGRLLTWTDHRGEPIFKRVQLNFKIGRDPTPDIEFLEKMISLFPYSRFILSYNESNAPLIRKMYHRSRVIFDCLYDSSFGEGVEIRNFAPPAFSDILQGYAGGLSAQNIAEKLDCLSACLGRDTPFFLDAEGKLKDENGRFSVQKACDFVLAIRAWRGGALIL